MKKTMKLALSVTLSLSVIGTALCAFPATAMAATTAAQKAQASGVLLNAADVVPEIVALGLSPQVYKVTTSQLQQLEYEQDKYVLQINIGRVTQEQFAKLHAMYGSQSQVPYNSNKAYNLIDFLPPVIQATVNHTFEQKSYDTKALWDAFDPSDESMTGELWGLVKNGASFFTNCWGTSIEVIKFLRDPQMGTYTFSWPARWSADENLKSDKYSKMVRSNQTRFGDVMLVSMKEAPGYMLQHTAVVVGENLLFEKTDTSDNDAYRLSLKADVLSKYSEIFGKNGKIQFRRFSADKEPLPPEPPLEPDFFEPATLARLRKLAPEVPFDHLTVGCETRLGGGCDIVYTESRPGQLMIDKNTGRGTIATDANTQKLFKDLE